MKCINYKSDFDFILRLVDADGNGIGIPGFDWSAKLWTSTKAHSITVSGIGGECSGWINDSGNIRVIVKNHCLPPGRLNIEFEALTPNGIYPGGIRKVVRPLTPDIELIPGAGDEDIDLAADIVAAKSRRNSPNVIKRCVTRRMPRMGSPASRSCYLAEFTDGTIKVNLNTKELSRWLAGRPPVGATYDIKGHGFVKVHVKGGMGGYYSADVIDNSTVRITVIKDMSLKLPSCMNVEFTATMRARYADSESGNRPSYGAAIYDDGCSWLVDFNLKNYQLDPQLDPPTEQEVKMLLQDGTKNPEFEIHHRRRVRCDGMQFKIWARRSFYLRKPTVGVVRIRRRAKRKGGSSDWVIYSFSKYGGILRLDKKN